ncbi:hypothetical protein [Bdellovibrio sp. BCCA]|uniref:hypothetical protein n=1 Tax=Bdellovibrio sp. BCCA TaxID=3136281 RepID=UPI0030EFEBC7
MKRILLVLLPLMVGLGGCQKTSEGGTTTGNPLINFKITGSSSAATVAFHRPNFVSPWLYEILKPAMALPPPSLVDSNGVTINLSEAWMVVRSVEFKPSETPDAGEVDGDSVSYEGPYVVNLLTATPESLGQVRVPTSTLRRIKMKLHNADSLPNTAPPALLNKSIYWKGSISGHDFTISSREGYEFELAGPNGVTLSDNSNVLMSIQIANLFKKMNFSGITSTTDIDENNRFPTANPCPSIDSSATDLYTCFTKGLKSESNLGRDDNGDDELSGDDSVK